MKKKKILIVGGTGVIPHLLTNQDVSVYSCEDLKDESLKSEINESISERGITFTSVFKESKSMYNQISGREKRRKRRKQERTHNKIVKSNKTKK